MFLNDIVVDATQDVGCGTIADGVRVSRKQDDSNGRVELQVSRHGATLKSSEGAMSSAARFLFPSRWRRAQDARQEARLLEALTDTALEKIQLREPLDGREQWIVEEMLRERFEVAAAKADLHDRATTLFPEMKKRMEQLPPAPAPTWNEGDWLRRLLHESEHITDDAMRDIFARILAGEAARPGSFHPRTLAAVASFDGVTAGIFEYATGLRIGDSFIFDDYNPDVADDLSLAFDELRELQDAGLVGYGTVGRKVRWKAVEGQPRQFQWTVECVNTTLRLRVVFEHEGVLPGTPEEVGVAGWDLTKAGAELALIPAPVAPDTRYLRAFAEKALRTAVVERGQYESYDGTAQWRPTEGTAWCEFEPPLRVEVEAPVRRRRRRNPNDED